MEKETTMIKHLKLTKKNLITHGRRIDEVGIYDFACTNREVREADLVTYNDGNQTVTLKSRYASTGVIVDNK